MIRSFHVSLTEGQFSALMSELDPDGTGRISYQHFLDLFEPRENLRDGHKWLKSVHRYNDKQKPVVMAWDTVSFFSSIYHGVCLPLLSITESLFLSI